MTDKNAIVKLGVDIYKNQVNTEFASANKDEQMEVFRKALIDANGGSDKLDYKSLRRNVEVFEIIEQILNINDIQGFEENDFFEQFVDYRNKALGDEDVFYIPDNSLFAVHDIAEGIGRSLRQRINTGEHKTIPTFLHSISTYEEANRLLSGRINLVEFVDRIKRSFAEKKAQIIYTTLYEGINELPDGFKITGTYNESDLLDIIAHVEASTGNDSIIVGTKKALSQVTTAVVSENARDRYNNLGYFGVFNGTPMLEIKQSHKFGTHEFAISDNDLWVFTSNDKPIKFVTEGDSIFEVGTVTERADRTIDIFAAERYGLAIVLNQYYGQFRISAGA